MSKLEKAEKKIKHVFIVTNVKCCTGAVEKNIKLNICCVF